MLPLLGLYILSGLVQKRRVCIIIFVRGCSVLSIPTNITSWTPCIKQHHMEWESLFLGDNYGILELSIQCSRNPSSGRNFTVAISVLFTHNFLPRCLILSVICALYTQYSITVYEKTSTV